MFSVLTNQVPDTCQVSLLIQDQVPAAAVFGVCGIATCVTRVLVIGRMFVKEGDQHVISPFFLWNSVEASHYLNNQDWP